MLLAVDVRARHSPLMHLCLRDFSYYVINLCFLSIVLFPTINWVGESVGVDTYFFVQSKEHIHQMTKE
jgi:hypothetical protein